MRGPHPHMASQRSRMLRQPSNHFLFPKLCFWRHKDWLLFSTRYIYIYIFAQQVYRRITGSIIFDFPFPRRFPCSQWIESQETKHVRAISIGCITFKIIHINKSFFFVSQGCFVHFELRARAMNLRVSYSRSWSRCNPLIDGKNATSEFFVPITCSMIQVLHTFACVHDIGIPRHKNVPFS